MQLKEKVVVITGGSKGFGRALAEAFIKEGSNVAICAVNEAELNRTCDETGAFGVVADVRKEEDMQKLFDKVIERFGVLDIWVNNAGKWMIGAPEDSDMNKVQEMFDVNVMGVLNGTKVALRYMKKKNSGLILNIISKVALGIRPGLSAYVASKWAVRGFVKTLRSELKEKDNPVQIFSVYPGGMQTHLFDENKPQTYRDYMNPKEVAEKVINNLRQNEPDPELVILGEKEQIQNEP